MDGCENRAPAVKEVPIERTGTRRSRKGQGAPERRVLALPHCFACRAAVLIFVLALLEITRVPGVSRAISASNPIPATYMPRSKVDLLLYPQRTQQSTAPTADRSAASTSRQILRQYPRARTPWPPMILAAPRLSFLTRMNFFFRTGAIGS